VVPAQRDIGLLRGKQGSAQKSKTNVNWHPVTTLQSSKSATVRRTVPQLQLHRQCVLKMLAAKMRMPANSTFV